MGEEKSQERICERMSALEQRFGVLENSVKTLAAVQTRYGEQIVYLNCEAAQRKLDNDRKKTKYAGVCHKCLCFLLESDIHRRGDSTLCSDCVAVHDKAVASKKEEEYVGVGLVNPSHVTKLESYAESMGEEPTEGNQTSEIESTPRVMTVRQKSIEQSELDKALEELEAIGWPCRLAELPRKYNELSRRYVEMRKSDELRGRRITQLENLLKKHGVDWRKSLFDLKHEDPCAFGHE